MALSEMFDQIAFYNVFDLFYSSKQITQKIENQSV